MLSTTGTLLTTVAQYFIGPPEIAGISAIIAAIGFCGIVLVPESKYWYVMHNKEEKALHSALW